MAVCGFAMSETVVLQDFEGGGTAGAFAVNGSNSFASSASNSAVANVSESGGLRLRLTDGDGGTNGCGITFTDAITEPGYYILTAAVKVDNASAPIGSFGLAATVGGPSTSKASDLNAGYVMNLTGSGDAALGYQTIGGAIHAYDGPFPKSITVYFGTNPSGNDFAANAISPGGTNAPATDGRFLNNHRTSTATWASGSSNAVYIDDVKLIGPGKIGEDRHAWISVGNSFMNLARLQMEIDNAELNHFNVVDFLARYRSDAYYVPNRDHSTYTNPEPFGTKISGGTPSAASDPLQYTIDLCRERGMKTYISFSSLLTGTNATYPAYLPPDSVAYYYNGGAPRPMESVDPGYEGLWADVGVPAMRSYLTDVCRDIVQNYNIDGVILDRVRYPDSSQYGYNPAALADMGIVGTPSPSDTNFVRKKREAVTTYIQNIYEGVTDVKPWVNVGTVPIVYGYNFSDTYGIVFQFFPSWTARKTRNRVIDFGVQDIMQHQLYRQANSPYENYNAVYMDYTRFGDVGRYSLDYGMSPGASTHLQPLFYHTSTDGTLSQSIDQAALIAQNFCDSRSKGLSGSGIFAGHTARANMHSIRNASTSPCGADVLASKSEHTDFLMKEGYDNEPPLAVTGLAGVDAGSLSVNLTWAAPAPAGDGETAAQYFIFRGTQPGVKAYYGTQRNKAVTVSAANYSDTVPHAGTYYYKVVPADDYNNHGPAVEIGPVAVAGPAAAGAPTAPSNVQVLAFGNAVYVTWNDNSTNETSFEVRRDGSTVATLSENLKGYRDDNVGSGSHTYVIRAVNAAGNSPSTSVNATAANLLAAPGAPSACNAGLGTNLTWTDTTSLESGFEILRGTSPGGPYTRAASVGPGIVSYSDTGLSIGTYYYRLRSFNGSALSLYSAEVSSVVTASASPGAPSGLGAAAAGLSVNLAWADNSCNESGFEIRRGTASGGPYTLIHTTAANAVTYTDTVPGIGSYYYIVRAFNGSESSTDSNEAAVTASAPAAPSGLSGPVAGPAVNLSWTDNSDNEGSFEVRRSTVSGGPYTTIATKSANVTAHVDVPGAGTFYYAVRAVNGLGASAHSNEIGATVVGTAPAAPSGLTATVTASRASLAWTDASIDETTFTVWRSIVSGGPYSQIGEVAAGTTSYADAGLGIGNHYYTVRAINGYGSSGDSNQATAAVADAACIIESRMPGGAATPSSAYAEGLGGGGVWGNTTAKSLAPGVAGSGGRFTGDGSLGSYAVFTPEIATGGHYNIYITLPAASGITSSMNNHSPGAGFEITNAGATLTGTFDLSRFNTLCDSTLLFQGVTNCWMLMAEEVPLAPGTSNTIRITNNHSGSANLGNRFDIDALRIELKFVPVAVSEWSLE